MIIQENFSLKGHNTFSIDVRAERFVSVETLGSLKDVLRTNHQKLILGGGSNVLFTKDVEGTVLHLNTEGIEVVEDHSTFVIIKVSAGENWTKFVDWAVSNDFGGVENLALIPGNVGSSPIQNIGAYGVELKDVFHSCIAIDINGMKDRVFSKEECSFSYRESIFKKGAKGQYVIHTVFFKLKKGLYHTPNIKYGAIAQFLEDIDKPTILSVSNAIKIIRRFKLPDPKKIPNAGSFFKNSFVEQNFFLDIQQHYPDVPFYQMGNNVVKIPAAWLIEKCGFKGYKHKNVGVYEKQSLVLVNHFSGKGIEIKQLAMNIREEVKKKFGIILDFEVNIL